ncbi:MAG: hypothetical protein WDZ80_01570 [Candidatus Paceibacterota bacterium]
MKSKFNYNSDFALQTGDSFLRLGVATRRWWNRHADEEAPTDIIPVIVNVSLGIELLLKSLVIQTNNKPKNTHKFWDLYRELPPDIKEKIKKHYLDNLDNDPKEKSEFSAFKIIATKGNKGSSDNDKGEADDRPDLKDLFRSHKNAFVNWRYLHELPDEGYEIEFNLRAMVAAGLSLRKVARDLALKKALEQGRPGLYWTKPNKDKQEQPRDDFSPLPFLNDKNKE